jgi:hypothetical protein
VSRIERFPLRLPIRYRPVGGGDWVQGTTENISGEGVLVRGAVLPELHASLDFRFAVQVGVHRSEVACRGAVVRTVTTGTGEQTFAATIDAFQFIGPSE